MAAPIVIKSTDPGVPVVAGIDSCIIALLDQYLLPLGWTKPFSGVNKAVFRPSNAVGNIRFYQVYDGVNVCGNKGGYYIRSFESMSDVDTGSGPSPVMDYRALISKAIWDTTSPRPWVLIADSSGFWLGIEANGIYSGQEHFMMNYTGEGIALWSDDSWFSIVTGHISTSADANNRAPLWPYYSANQGAWGGVVARPITGAVNTIGNSRIYSVSAGSDTEYLGVNNPSSRNYPWRGKLVYSRPIIKDVSASDARGYLPGLYDPSHSGGFTRYQIIEDGTKRLMAIDHLCGNNSPGWMLIDIGEGFRTL